MYKWNTTYVDYDGNSRTEDFYFNLNKAELAEMDLKTEGGFEKYVNKIISAQDNKTLVELFKEIILMSYGEKSLDGRRFIKSEELSREFSQTEAYSTLFTTLAVDADFATEFINGIVPQEQANSSIPAPPVK